MLIFDNINVLMLKNIINLNWLYDYSLFVKNNLIITILVVATFLQIIIIKINLFIDVLLYAAIRDEYGSDIDQI